MSDPLQYNTGATLLANVRADVDTLMGATDVATSGTGDGGGGGGETGGPLADVLGDLKDILQRLIDALNGGGEGGGSGAGGGGGGSVSPAAEPDVIAGSGRIWGDPHFIGADGGKFDVQGEAGKTYNLLSDQDFQMNGTFDEWGSSGSGKTVVGKVGIAAGSDQVEVHKDGTVMVNGQELAEGERVELANGGYVQKNANDTVELKSGEWEVDFQIRDSSNGDHINMDVRTDNAIADGVKPHGLLGQTFDGDGEARNGDSGQGTQGGGAIEGADGEITERGETDHIGLYEVDGIHDRNFTEFNQFFDDAESGEGAYDAELSQMMSEAFGMMAQAMFAMMQHAGGQQNA